MSRNKAIGVVSGVLDLILYVDNTLIAFDIKVGKDKLSKEQENFIKAVEHAGGRCYVIESFEQFKNIVDNLFTFIK